MHAIVELVFAYYAFMRGLLTGFLLVVHGSWNVNWMNRNKLGSFLVVLVISQLLMKSWFILRIRVHDCLLFEDRELMLYCSTRT